MIFMIGPASVGKSSVGSRLAQEMGYAFVDIDYVFCERLGVIPNYIDTHGYPAYCEANSKLTDEIIASRDVATVYSTPAGFLAHEDSPLLVDKHKKLVQQGVSILLLPGENPEDGADIIAERQTKRWPEAQFESERRKHIGRYALYRELGDIQIIGQYDIETTIRRILSALGEFRKD